MKKNKLSSNDHFKKLNIDLMTVKNFLRVEHQEDDLLLKNYIESAIDYAQKILNSDLSLHQNPLIKSAILTHISLLYDNKTNPVDLTPINYTYQLYRQYKII